MRPSFFSRFIAASACMVLLVLSTTPAHAQVFGRNKNSKETDLSVTILKPSTTVLKGTTFRYTLTVKNLGPKNAEGIVVFAHGSGSSRHSPRNKYVAQVLQKSGLATLLLDLLTEEEEKVDDYTAHIRFDIELLAKRLSGATSPWRG